MAAVSLAPPMGELERRLRASEAAARAQLAALRVVYEALPENRVRSHVGRALSQQGQAALELGRAIRALR